MLPSTVRRRREDVWQIYPRFSRTFKACYRPTTANDATKRYLFCKFDGGEQTKDLAKSIDTSQPEAVRDFCQLREATFSFGWNKCKGKDGKWKIPNFGTILLPH